MATPRKSASAVRLAATMHVAQVCEPYDRAYQDAKLLSALLAVTSGAVALAETDPEALERLLTHAAVKADDLERQLKALLDRAMQKAHEQGEAQAAA